MFTGIVEEIGIVQAMQKTPKGAIITVKAPQTVANLKVGDSVSTAGTCLTCTSLDGESFTADLSDQTLKTTTLGNVKSGDRINLELALTLAKRLGGHLVSGHVDGIGKVRKIQASGDAKVFTFSAPPAVFRYIIPKGSVAIDGVSLTIAEVIGNDAFTVALIPHTLEVTTLGTLEPGDEVNMEADMIGKYVERLVIGYRDEPSDDINLGKALKEAGFL